MTEEKRQALKAALFDCMTAGGDLDQLCTLIAGALENPVSLHLPSRTIVARSRDFTQAMVDDFVNAFSLEDADTTAAAFDGLVRRLKSQRPVIEVFPYYRYKQILYGCFSDDHLTAILACPIVRRGDMNEMAEVLGLAASAVVPALRQNGYLGRRETHHMQVYLNALLRGERQALYQQLGSANSAVNNTSSWRLMAFICPDEAARGEVWEACEVLCARREKLWCTDYEGHKVVLMDEALAFRIQEFSEICPPAATLIVSDPYRSLAHTRNAYVQMLDVYEIAGILGDRPQPVYVSEYKSALYFLYAYLDSDRQDRGNNPFIQVGQYDLENGTEYCETLKCYLLNEMNCAIMAEKLHVHKNTILYRLQRAGELFDLNLKDCRVITDLYLGLFLAECPGLALKGSLFTGRGNRN